MAKAPVNRETIKKLLDALTPMNPETAEKFVHDILRLADERRKDLERVVGDVAKAGVRTAEGLAVSVQHEMGRQITKMAGRIDDLERQVETLSKTLESTRANLLSLASRSLSKGQDAPPEESSTTKKKTKSSRKVAKKADKRARSTKNKKMNEDAASSPTVSDSSRNGQGDSSPAVAGI